MSSTLAAARLHQATISCKHRRLTRQVLLVDSPFSSSASLSSRGASSLAYQSAASRTRIVRAHGTPTHATDPPARFRWWAHVPDDELIVGQHDETQEQMCLFQFKLGV